MAATLDNQLSQQHDLSHDTLMGLDELDSHLGMFEPSLDSARQSSTPDARSMSPIDGSISSFDQASQTIIVDAPIESYSRKHQSTASSSESRAKPGDGKTMSTGVSQYVLLLYRSLTLNYLCNRHPELACTHILTSLW